jgi:hypothetical protein
MESPIARSAAARSLGVVAANAVFVATALEIRPDTSDADISAIWSPKADPVVGSIAWNVEAWNVVALIGKE